MEKSRVGEHLDRKLDIAPALKTFVKVEAFLVFACVLTEAYCNLVLHLRSPYAYPFIGRDQTFWDFTMFWANFRSFHHLGFFMGTPFLYPAPVAVAYEMFYYFSHPLLLFIGFILLSFLFAGILLGRALLRRGTQQTSTAIFIACILILAYPFWFDLKQGNIEICVWLILTVGVWAFLRQRNYCAAACFGIAGSMKIFPFLYVGLLLSRRKYREIAFAVFVALVTTISSLWLLGGDIVGTWHHVQSGVDQFRTVYVLHFRAQEIGFDHSLFAVYKHSLPHLRDTQISGTVLNLYLAVAAVSGTVFYFAKIRHLPVINQVICLCIVSVLLPPVSYDYTLMHLYVPCGLLVLFAQEQWNTKNEVPGLTVAFVCFAVLMAPESEFIYHAVRFGGQIKAITLVVLMYIAMKYPFDESALDLTNARSGHLLYNRPNPASP